MGHVTEIVQWGLCVKMWPKNYIIPPGAYTKRRIVLKLGIIDTVTFTLKLACLQSGTYHRNRAMGDYV